ncbi:hypothetical protein N7522_003579 [Penicillium canescens]|nr:hypothetical protein N7522_003579 [Penicillium canescens]
MEKACHLFPMYGVIFLSYRYYTQVNFSRCIQSMESSMLCFTPRSFCALSISIVIHIDSCSSGPIRSCDSSIAKRLRLRREKLSKHVHTCGYKTRGDCSRILYVSALGHSGRNIGPGTILALHNVCFQFSRLIGLGSSKPCAKHAKSQNLFNAPCIGTQSMSAAKHDLRGTSSRLPEYPAEDSVYL